MQNWYTNVRNRTEPILETIRQLEFIKELSDGRLPQDIFHYYIAQDAHYLAFYKKVLAAVGIRCDREEDVQFFLHSATGIIEVENALHGYFLGGRTELPPPSPSCDYYVSYLCRMASFGTREEALAAVLPCFTIYKEIGDYILAKQQGQDNPYQEWIATYGGEEFGKSVEQAIDIVNRYAANAPEQILAKMEAAFVQSSRLEWLFWESAYRKEQWAV